MPDSVSLDTLLPCLVAFLLGGSLGGAIAWFLSRAQTASESALMDKFKALAADSLNANNEAFIHLAETRLKQSEQAAASVLERKSASIDELVKPVKESLTRMDAQLQALEVKREGAYRELTEMVKQSNDVQKQLRGETGQLLQALQTPTTRGRWGEIQLRRILEMTGMSAHTRDFTEQLSISGEDGTLRPDMIVNLPGERCVIIDSKAPLSSYLDATRSANDGERAQHMKLHAKRVRDHVKALAAKAYWDQVDGAPDFVVMFMPGDHFLAAALDDDPDLMDFCVGNKVVLATPMTLVALLRTVHSSWRQESLRENARKVGELGNDLYAALTTMTDHLMSLGGKIEGSLDAYNRLIGSYERNALSKARKLREFGAAKEGKDLPEALDPIDRKPRSLTFITEETTKQDDAA
ncbi:MAG: DNA recombination protein RmuC [Bdellovibrionales bacterium]